jgi:CheY-like chemotaxis protein
MDAETLGKVFDPFFSTKFTGRGLGMAAVLGIVRGHNGAIKLETALGKGSCFKVLFPASDKTVKVSRREEFIIPQKNSGLVLLVDDEELVRRTGREMLEEIGFEVLTAKNGREAVDIFSDKHRQISFVLMDMTMPEMDGEEACHELKKIYPTVKVIICSGYNEQEITPKFAPLELAGFLKKPFRFTELQQAIQRSS